VSTEDDLVAARRRHVEALRAAGATPYPNDFVPDDTRRRELAALGRDDERRAALPREDEIAPDADEYPLYGRVMAKRGPFLVVQTPHGSIQALVRPDELAANEAAQYRAVDLADHVALHGPAMRTGTGALAVKARRYRHLAKALLPPPAKWHGLSDVETRYRRRYVDLFANPEVSEVFRARGRIVSAIRALLDARGFLEVETPLLHATLTGATARPFRTHHETLDIPLYLRVAPELYLKRLVVGGLDRVYEIGRNFRNEGVSTKHNPEFTMLEAYQAYGTYADVMELTEALVRTADQAVREAFPKLIEGRAVALDGAWPRVTMRQLIAETVARASELDLSMPIWSRALTHAVVHDADALDRELRNAGALLQGDAKAALGEGRSYGARIQGLFELLVEPALPRLYRTPDATQSLPVFVTEHPIEVSPLARANDQDPRFVDRFELFVEHREVANGFSELNDPDDQAERMRRQVADRERGAEDAMEFDADYVRALEHGMPPTAGLGVGIDRFAMTLCNQPSIRDVLLFPLLRPEVP
jgi:lysyl-tRNA synthetase class 2